MGTTKPTELDLLVAERIRMQRARARITLRSLSELTGISYPVLSRIERGERSATLGQIAQITAALGIDLQTLLES